MNKDFSITFSTMEFTPDNIYYNRKFKCPVCGFETVSSANIKGEPKPYCPNCFIRLSVPVMEVVEDKS